MKERPINSFDHWEDNHMGMRYCIGIDIGGTTVKMGLFTVEGRLVEKWEIPTRHEDAGGHILEDVAASLKKKLADEDYSWNDVAGVGLDVPGPVQPDGYVSVCVNLGWMDLYPAQELSKLLGGGINCYVGNDAESYEMRNEQDKTHFVLSINGESEFAPGWTMAGEAGLQKGAHDKDVMCALTLKRMW